MRGRTYDEISIGDTGSFSKTITESDIHSFSAITADFNAIHVDEVYATTSSLGKKMGGRIAQGMLSASLFSTPWSHDRMRPRDGPSHSSFESRFSSAGVWSAVCAQS